MKIETKFNINDKVYSIKQERRKEWQPCVVCVSKGEVMLGDKQWRPCPECYGKKGKYVYFDLEWQVLNPVTIGKVEAEVQNITPDDEFAHIGHFEEGKTVQQNEYMAYETGIGSGTIWKEDILFASLEEAQTECDKRNVIKEIRRRNHEL